MTADSSANMARGHSTYTSGPQGAAVKLPTTAAARSLSTTHSPSKAADAPVRSSGKSPKGK
jgi:hypothetical protein